MAQRGLHLGSAFNRASTSNPETERLRQPLERSRPPAIVDATIVARGPLIFDALRHVEHARCAVTFQELDIPGG